MPFEIVRNDITLMNADAIVYPADPRPMINYGVEMEIHRKAGPQLWESRKKIGILRPGQSAISPGFELPARYVIHTASPVWRGGMFGERQILRSCYLNSLNLAYRNHCKSIAFPLLSAGNHGFPKDQALRIALDVIQDFLTTRDMQVYLVVFSRDAFQLSGKLFHNVSSFIDDHYVQQANFAQYGSYDKCQVRYQQQQRILQDQLRWEKDFSEPEDVGVLPCPSASEFTAEERKPAAKKVPKSRGFSLPLPKPKPTLAQLLEQTDAGFSETLLKLIDRTGKKDSQIYTKANISRQHFSKIRNNPDYKPTKSTAIAFAIALELDLEQTRDLIGRAGYALTTSSKFDVIIMYFIQERNYNIMDINATLFEFDQSLLGA